MQWPCGISCWFSAGCLLLVSVRWRLAAVNVCKARCATQLEPPLRGLLRQLGGILSRTAESLDHRYLVGQPRTTPSAAQRVILEGLPLTLRDTAGNYNRYIGDTAATLCSVSDLGMIPAYLWNSLSLFYSQKLYQTIGYLQSFINASLVTAH